MVGYSSRDPPPPITGYPTGGGWGRGGLFFVNRLAFPPPSSSASPGLLVRPRADGREEEEGRSSRPCANQAHNTTMTPSCFSLLPPELHVCHVSGFLPHADRLAMALTCRDLRAAYRHAITGR